MKDVTLFDILGLIALFACGGFDGGMILTLIKLLTLIHFSFARILLIFIFGLGFTMAFYLVIVEIFKTLNKWGVIE